MVACPTCGSEEHRVVDIGEAECSAVVGEQLVQTMEPDLNARFPGARPVSYRTHIYCGTRYYFLSEEERNRLAEQRRAEEADKIAREAARVAALPGMTDAHLLAYVRGEAIPGQHFRLVETSAASLVRAIRRGMRSYHGRYDSGRFNRVSTRLGQRVGWGATWTGSGGVGTGFWVGRRGGIWRVERARGQEIPRRVTRLRPGDIVPTEWVQHAGKGNLGVLWFTSYRPQ
jgi:hypothetical protein